MSCEELFPGIILLVLGQFTDPLLGLPLLFDRIVSLIGDGDARELVFALLARIQGKNLILFILIETQVSMIFYRAVGELARSPYQAALLGTFLTHEQHARGIPAIRPG